MNIFTLPDLGEGLSEAEIVKWHVKAGDSVLLDQTLVSVETAKAIVDIPSPSTGIIKKIFYTNGSVVETGKPLVEFESAKDSIVGNLSSTQTTLTDNNDTIKINKPQHDAVKATPAIRKLAKELNVNLADILGTGPNNTITKSDVENAQSSHNSSLTGAKRTMALNMQKSIASVVPATICDDAVLSKYSSNNKDLTVQLIQAIAEAISKEPALNALHHTNKMQTELKKELNLGLATDFDDLLFVPVIADAANKSAEQLRAEINNLKQKTIDRSLSLQDMQNPTFILSNIGKFGGRYANPVILPPTVAILVAGKVREQVIARNGSPTISWVLPLSLTFDHRACTGGQATRFLAAVINSMENV